MNRLNEPKRLVPCISAGGSLENLNRPVDPAITAAVSNIFAEMRAKGINPLTGKPNKRTEASQPK